MFKNLMKLSVVLVLLFSFNLANACEIELKDGRIITAESCWEEGDMIKYEMYGATVGLEKEKVKRINHKEYDGPKIQKDKTAQNVFNYPDRINFKQWVKIDPKNYQGWSKCVNNCRNRKTFCRRSKHSSEWYKCYNEYIMCKEGCNEKFHPIMEDYQGESAYSPESQTPEARQYRRNCWDDCHIAGKKYAERGDQSSFDEAGCKKACKE